MEAVTFPAEAFISSGKMGIRCGEIISIGPSVLKCHSPFAPRKSLYVPPGWTMICVESAFGFASSAVIYGCLPFRTRFSHHHLKTSKAAQAISPAPITQSTTCSPPEIMSATSRRNAAKSSGAVVTPKSAALPSTTLPKMTSVRMVRASCGFPRARQVVGIIPGSLTLMPSSTIASLRDAVCHTMVIMVTH